MAGDERREAVLRYHERSTHQPGRHARGPGFLDWANQPDPFRTYAGAPVTELPLAVEKGSASWGVLHRPGGVPPRPLDKASLGAFFELALGITAWKEQGGTRWALRANPSSGNLHPTEGYLLVGEAAGVSPGLHHYVSRDHVLEQRWAPTPAGDLARLWPRGAFVLGLASIHWREAWKYGERALRYCQHDVGHALGAVRLAAAVLGWSARLLEAPGDDDVSAILGLDRESDVGAVDPVDREHPDALVVVAPAAGVDRAARQVEDALDPLRQIVGGGTWAGTPNALSPDHVEWPAIVEVTAATAKARTLSRDPPPPGADAPPAQRSGDGRSDRAAGCGLLRHARPAHPPPGHASVGRAAVASSGAHRSLRPPRRRGGVRRVPVGTR
jgi:SagB-type dehydrogenase family enzyme